MTDKTLSDINRRELDFNQSLVAGVLPEYFGEDNPKLITLLEEYYKWHNSGTNPGKQLFDLAKTRDIGQTPQANLTYIEDELLLGQNYLEGVLDKRTGAELSNNYYRTKGTKYGIERFFRAFFGTDPVIEYGKDLVFEVGNTIIGPNSGKYIQNDKVYQYWGLLIKIDIPQSEWLQIYKLFAHPGGMYVGSEVQVVSVNENISIDYMPISVPPLSLAKSYEGVASVFSIGRSENSGVIGNAYSNADSDMRLDLNTHTVEQWVTDSASIGSNLFGSVGYMEAYYQSVKDVQQVTSPLMDEDSSGGDSTSMKMSNIYETMDQDKYLLQEGRQDSDGSGNLLIDSDGNGNEIW
jgi:hypothetical protein